MFKSSDAAGVNLQAAVSLSLGFYYRLPNSLFLIMQIHVNLAVHPFAPLLGLLELRVTSMTPDVSPLTCDSQLPMTPFSSHVLGWRSWAMCRNDVKEV